MVRSVKPEILDALPINHPDALHSRRDIRLFNRVMGNDRWLSQTLPSKLRPSDRILEIGAGDGKLGLALAPRLLTLDGLDLWPRPSHWPQRARWHQTCFKGFTAWGDYSVFIGSLVLHQFSGDDLRWLGTRFGEHGRLLIFSEPARRRFFQWAFRALCLFLGANYVSRHDGVVSIAGGFLDDELPALLGLDHRVWTWRWSVGLFGAYRLVAEKRR